MLLAVVLIDHVHYQQPGGARNRHGRFAHGEACLRVAPSAARVDEQRRVDIDDSLMEDDKEMVEDLVAAAFNDAVRRVEEQNKDKMGDVTGGMQMPPGFKMPF